MFYFRNIHIIYILYLSFFFNIERINIWGSDSVGIDRWIYIYGVLLALILSYQVIISSLNIHFVIILNLIVYVICKTLFFVANPLLSGIFTYLSITEMTLLSILAWLAYQQSQAMTDFETAVTSITFETGHRPIPSLDDALDDIQKYMRTGRRHNSPISLVMINPDSTTSQAFVARAIQDVQRSLQTRYTLTALSRVFEPLLRRTDLVVEQRRQGQLMIVCPMTDAAESTVLVQRLHATAQRVGIPIQCGSASFPDEALTFDDLIAHAASQLSLYDTGFPSDGPLNDMEIAAPAKAEVTLTS